MRSPNTILQSRYRVIRELGHGGMGTVYEALDQRMNCIIALKETSAVKDNEARLAFEREAALLGNLRHPALPKVMDYFSEDGADFLVMEFIHGYDLAELLELRAGPFPQNQVIRWATALLKVLEYLHGQNPPILHRDIKPSNLKLTKRGELFLLDFGLAKGAAGQMQTLVTSRSVRGYTPLYASLEQIHGYGTDPRSDLYSLGATLYHLLTGVAPVDSPKRFSALEDEQPDPLDPIEKLAVHVSPNVAVAIHRAMALNRRQRPASATEMRKSLQSAIEKDEQEAAEEEYRGAEERRKQRLDDRSPLPAENPPQFEAERRQEAETRDFEEAKQRTREAQEERRHDGEAERLQTIDAPTDPRNGNAKGLLDARDLRPEKPLQHGNVLPTVLAPTEPAQDSSGSEPTKPHPPIKTLKAYEPEKLLIHNEQFDASKRISTDKQSPAKKKNQTIVIVAVSLIGIIFLSLGWWIITKRKHNLESANTNRVPQANQPQQIPTPPPGLQRIEQLGFSVHIKESEIYVDDKDQGDPCEEFVVWSVDPFGPADTAGLKKEDVIVRLNTVRFDATHLDELVCDNRKQDMSDLLTAIRRARNGTVNISVGRYDDSTRNYKDLNLKIQPRQ